MKKGERVRTTEGWLRATALTEHEYGVVVSVRPNRNQVRVLRDGFKTVNSYHISFWEAVSEGAATK